MRLKYQHHNFNAFELLWMMILGIERQNMRIVSSNNVSIRVGTYRLI